MSRRPPLRLRQVLGLLLALSGTIIVVATIAGAFAYSHLSDNRRSVVTRIDPSIVLVSQLLANYLDMETGVRGYALSGEPLFLQPYQSGAAGVAAAQHQLGTLLRPGSTAGELLVEVRRRAAAWQTGFAEPSVAATAAGNRAFDSEAELAQGKARFDALRQSIASLQQELAAERGAAENRLYTSSEALLTVMVASLVVIVLDGVLIWTALRRMVVRPLAAVGTDTRKVAGGKLDHEVRRSGPVEVAELSSDIEAMRRRIFAELRAAEDARAELEVANAELARSNEDLEGFAYLASHDLQEPLRKVASFCQLLEQRYADQLDERGRQYIAFAVDGARRMQVLIDDLLAFSRIGRTTERFDDVDLGACLRTAQRDLSGTIDAAGGTVVAGPLPQVRGDGTLLTALMENLVGNAIKFHADATPVVRVDAERGDEGHWLVSVADNGIGIDPSCAERIFVIFQRLHGRDSYPGTGIGLALCRKIVEFHGGRIWLDTKYRPGARFCFTLPPVPSVRG